MKLCAYDILCLLDGSPTGFHIVYALVQLYMYDKNCVITVDTAAVRLAWMALRTVTVVEVSCRRSDQGVG